MVTGWKVARRWLVALLVMSLAVGCTGDQRAGGRSVEGVAEAESQPTAASPAPAAPAVLDKTDALAGVPDGVDSFSVLTEEEAALLLKALDMYNWTAEDLEADLQLARDRLRLINDDVAECMARDGFRYIHPTPEESLGQWSGFEHQFGTEEWAKRYGFGITTLKFLQETLPEPLIGAPSMLTEPEASESSEEAQYLRSLGEDGMEKYNAALNGGPEACVYVAYAKYPQYESQGAVQFETFDPEDLKARALASPEYVAARDAAYRCVVAEGFDVRSEQEAVDTIVEVVAYSGLETPEYVNWDVSPSVLTDKGIELLAELQEAELRLAETMWNCGAVGRHLDVIAGEVAVRLYAEMLAAADE